VKARAEIEQMRGDLTLARIKEQWTSWRRRAIEPLVRESLARLLPDGLLPAAPAIGGYWTRSNDIGIDLVGADRRAVALPWFGQVAKTSARAAPGALRGCGSAARTGSHAALRGPLFR
jgi:hypothetical protein